MKYILVSVKKKYVDLIFSGKKLLEMRLTAPNEDLPIKVFIYETFGRYNNITKQYEGSGKVVGEFILNNIKEFDVNPLEKNKYLITQQDLDIICLTYEELCEYGGGRKLYGWKVNNELCKYRTPINLSEFNLKRPPQSWQYLSKNSIKNIIN